MHIHLTNDFIMVRPDKPHTDGDSAVSKLHALSVGTVVAVPSLLGSKVFDQGISVGSRILYPTMAGYNSPEVNGNCVIFDVIHVLGKEVENA